MIALQHVPTIHIGPVSIQLTDSFGGQFVARGKWRAFYLLLITNRGQIVDRLSVSQLKGWSGDVVAVGREIARHLSSSRVARLVPLPVLSERPTLEWSLDPQWKVVDARASKTSLTAELEQLFREPTLERTSAMQRERAIAAGLMCCEAQLLFYEGRLQEASLLARAVWGEETHFDLRAVAGLVALRAEWRLSGTEGERAAVSRLETELLALPKSEVVLNIQDRMQIFRALHSAPSEWEQTAQDLARMARQVSRGMDFAQAAYGENYSALIRRRLDQPEEAQGLIQRALLHAAASGDVYLMQIVSFNLGLIFSEISIETWPGAADIALRALRFVHRIARDHHIGNDSAQNELLIADLYLRKGDVAAARAELDIARRLVNVTANLYDRAELLRLDARLLMAKRQGAWAQEAQRLLADAIALYQQAERHDLAQSTQVDLDGISLDQTGA